MNIYIYIYIYIISKDASATCRHRARIWVHEGSAQSMQCRIRALLRFWLYVCENDCIILRGRKLPPNQKQSKEAKQQASSMKIMSAWCAVI